MFFDVVIIGSGPAGSAAALACVRNGLTVSMISARFLDAIEYLNDLEQASESVHPGVETLLKQLDAADCLQSASRGIYTGVQSAQQLKQFSPNENERWEVHHISRKRFDFALMNMA